MNFNKICDHAIGFKPLWTSGARIIYFEDIVEDLKIEDESIDVNTLRKFKFCPNCGKEIDWQRVHRVIDNRKEV